MRMAVTIFGSTGCLRGHRLRGSFKLATPYVVANQARVTFAGRSEPVPAQNDHERHPRCRNLPLCRLTEEGLVRHSSVTAPDAERRRDIVRPGSAMYCFTV